MAEYIEREKAIDYLMEIIDRPNHPEWLWTDEICGSLNTIPAADARPVRRGKWVDHPRWKWIYAECSECEVVSDVKSNFCPNCGADMREES